MKISCDVITDLLPLYYDKICSQATIELVEEHLVNCPKCRKELKNMATTLSLEQTQSNHLNDAKLVTKISRQWQKDRLLSVLKGIGLTLLILLFVYMLLGLKIVPSIGG
ncbi:zf-HC2 domain-containing protein [Vagococcus sp. BWB3-3]|uniref:Zf-HC2 domain-containing protein n=1 Tax=Vagococcus allomyrinae TaxID=2794353 RepID=A0A940P6S7_9ENTE|nr:zf-HC2 domain-containing protein [Vagococcus allomyrinae]MBP1042679.1 zf-HC2 domain-containing protein [Vagococcus allomyrinae]